MDRTFSAAILAGGRATRFGGRDKSALVVDGRPILDRQIGELSPIVDELLVVGAGSETRRVEGVRYIADRIPGSGPMGGIHAALTEAAGAATLAVACDMPYVSAGLGGLLLSLTIDADLVVPQTEAGYHPLYAAYTRACLEPIARRLASGRLKLTGLFDDVRVHVVTVDQVARFGPPDRLLANVNTLDEYSSIEASRP